MKAVKEPYHENKTEQLEFPAPFRHLVRCPVKVLQKALVQVCVLETQEHTEEPETEIAPPTVLLEMIESLLSF